MTLRLSRIAVTAPPKAWFHGITRITYELCRQALVDLGASVFEVPVDAFLPPDPGRISDIVDDLRSFRPDLAFGLPYLSQALVCRLPPERDGWRPNLFTDLLGIPTLGSWDHAPFELADQLLTPHPAGPADSRDGVMASLQRALVHDRVIPWSRDSGQSVLMRDLGLISSAPLQEMTPALPATRSGPSATGGVADVAFIGHFYQSAPGHADPALTALAGDAIADWLARGGTMWDSLQARISSVPVDRQRELRLSVDDSFFWSFAHRTIIHDAHTENRLHLLGAAGVPVACYGDLRTDLAGVPANLAAIPGHIPFGPQLDTVLARHPITVDVTSPGFPRTISQKLFRGFDSGGFMLVDRKPDFIAAFGDLGEAISYADGADLAAKIDTYLARPALRREIGDAMRARIAFDRRLPDVLARVLARAAERDLPPSVPPPREAPPANAVDMLGRIKRPLLFSGASLHRQADGLRIVTPAKAWRYAAVLKARGRRLCLTLRVEAGKLAIGVAVPGRATLIDDRFVSPSRQPVDLDLELPGDRPATVVFRSSVAGITRAVVTRALLYDG